MPADDAQRLAEAARAASARWNATPSIMPAILVGDLELARELRAQGATVTERDDEGLLPLIEACKLDEIEAARWLIAEGAAIEGEDEDGRARRRR